MGTVGLNALVPLLLEAGRMRHAGFMSAVTRSVRDQVPEASEQAMTHILTTWDRETVQWVAGVIWDVYQREETA